MRSGLVRSFAVSISVAMLASCSGEEPTRQGGSGSQSPSSYAEGMCSAATVWRSALEEAETKRRAAASAGSGIEARRDAWATFLGDAVVATDVLIAEVSSLDPPAVEGGGRLHEAVISAFTQARDLYADGRERMETTDASDRALFAGTVEDLQASLVRAGTDIAASLEGLTTPELVAAFAATPACAALVSS